LGLGATVEYVNLAAGDANIGKVVAQGTAVGTMVSPGTAIVLTVGRDAASPTG
jgi:beta-lactam-binding protein with PASTA domain